VGSPPRLRSRRSRLLIVTGEVNEKKGKYYFEWVNNRLKVIRAILKE